MNIAGDAGQREVLRDVLPVELLELAQLGLLLHVSADHAHARKILLHAAADVGEHGLDALEAVVNDAARSSITATLTTGAGRMHDQRQPPIDESITAMESTKVSAVSHQYITPGPSIMRTAFRSLVARAMMSPVRVRE